MRPLILLLAGCAATADAPVPPTPQVSAEAEAAPTYNVRLATLDARRLELAEAYRTAGDDDARTTVLAEARTTLDAALRNDLFPAWAGTTWGFYGTSTVPGRGEIACGHYVSVVLAHAGFEVERLKLGRQASENIIKTFSKPKDIRRFSRKPADDVVAAVRQMGPGTFVLGLDYHAAFLISDGQAVQMCHSSYLGPAAVMCEDAATSPAMVSDYRVVGKLFDDDMVRRWLRGERFPTVGNG